ncbi:MAG: nucleotide exchange factor GrpE [Candidatus Bathyarchaeota archaeon]
MVQVIPPFDEDCEKELSALKLDEVGTLTKELEEEKAKAIDYLNQLKYLQADFENYKKRVKKEIDDTRQCANRRLILELLTVIDELDCAVEAGKQETGKAFLEGVEMTLHKLNNILKKEGLIRIETVGKPFDPVKHEAVFRVSTDKEDGIILEEIRKGYMFKDVVIRPSLVKVAINNSKKGE